MTFEEWWETVGIHETGSVTGILVLSFKQLTKQAWDTAISCPKCGKDMRVNTCRYCPPHDVEKYYKEG